MRQISASHIRILKALQSNRPYVEIGDSPVCIQFKRQKTTYNILLLNELQSLGYVDAERKVTVTGHLFLLLNT